MDRKKKLTKKMAEILFKNIFGTSRGVTKVENVNKDIWQINLGILTATLSYEVIYLSSGEQREGKHIKMYIKIAEGEYAIYFDAETLEMDQAYTNEKNDLFQSGKMIEHLIQSG